jgi:hypothetical protein
VIPGFNPVIELVKLPVPVPSVVLLLETVGAADVFQQTPLAVTLLPPSLVILPPAVAPAEVTEVAAVVVIVGRTIEVVKVTSLP